MSERALLEAARRRDADAYGAIVGLHRGAHRAVDERLPELSQQATLRTLGDAALRDLVGGYADAWERADVDASSRC